MGLTVKLLHIIDKCSIANDNCVLPLTPRNLWMCIHQWKIEGTTVSRLTQDVNIPRQRPHSFIFAIADASTCISKPPLDLSVSTLSSVHCDRTSQGQWPNRLSGVSLRSGPSHTNTSGIQYGGELLVRFGFSQRDWASSTATLWQRWLRSLNACRDLEKIA